MFRILAASTLALVLGACATQETSESESSRDCFRTLDVRGYGVVDEQRIRVRVSPQREYILTLIQPTRDIDWTHAISLRSVTSFICVGSGNGVQVMGGDPPIATQVTRIERAPNNEQPSGS